MRRINCGVLNAFMAVVLSASQLLAAPVDDPCSFAGGLDSYLNALLGEQISAGARERPALQASAEKVANEGADDSTKRPEGEGAGGGGLDAYKKLFVALELGSISEEDKALTFNIRPDWLDFGSFGSASMRAVVREPAIFSELVSALDALPGEVGAPAKKDLEEELADTDDVEYQLRWDFGSRAASSQASRIASVIFDASYDAALGDSRREAAEAIARIVQKLTAFEGVDEETPLAQVCATQPEARRQLEAARAVADSILNANLEELGSALSRMRFREVGDLMEGQPRFALDAAYRSRADAVGPNTTTARALFQMGDRSFWSWGRWAKRNGRSLDIEGLGDYLSGKNSRAGGRSTLKLAAEYSETSGYAFDRPEVGLTLDMPKAKIFAATLSVGRSLSEARRSRVDLEARFEDASGDPTRNDRFVSTLSWTQKLSDGLATMAGGSNLVVAAVYANEPEYRGDVDKELSLRAGLKWSIDGDSKENEERAEGE